MSHLKNNNLKKCFFLLRDFVEASTAEEHKKGTAILTLNQLQKIIAGDGVIDGSGDSCNGRPILGLS